MKTNFKMSLILSCIFLLSAGCDETVDIPVTTIKDIDGNVYQTAKIGDQEWLVENLRVVHYRNGDSIPNVKNGTQWGQLTTGAYCNYNNDDYYVKTYGRLYNAYAVIDPRNIAPEGWHVATHEDYVALEEYLGGVDLAGGKMKEEGTTHWSSPNTGATNYSGFKGLPGGNRSRTIGSFQGIYYQGSWWTSTEYDTVNNYARFLNFDESVSSVTWAYRYIGMSVRCVKE
jgi:uncharacterized protein (TIGR02145 family)